MVDIQPAGERPEGRQDQLGLGAQKAAARDAAAPDGHAQLGVEMAGQLRPGFARFGLVPQQQSMFFQFGHGPATPAATDFAIVIAADPYPVERAGQPLQDAGGAGGQPRFTGIVMIIVAKAEDALWPGACDQRVDRLHRGAAVIGGQHLPGGGEEAALFQMQIGQQQRAARRPPQGSVSRHEQAVASERKGNHHRSMRAPRVRRKGRSAELSANRRARRVAVRAPGRVNCTCRLSKSMVILENRLITSMPSSRAGFS